MNIHNMCLYLRNVADARRMKTWSSARQFDIRIPCLQFSKSCVLCSITDEWIRLNDLTIRTLHFFLFFVNILVLVWYSSPQVCVHGVYSVHSLNGHWSSEFELGSFHIEKTKREKLERGLGKVGKSEHGLPVACSSSQSVWQFRVSYETSLHCLFIGSLFFKYRWRYWMPSPHFGWHCLHGPHSP